MKRLLLWAATTAVLALFTSPAASAPASAPIIIGQAELDAAVGAGCLVKCPKADPAAPQVVGHQWQETHRLTGEDQQLNYSVWAEHSNVRGLSPIHYTLRPSNGCRYVFTSGGNGIAAAFGVKVGYTYVCDTLYNFSGTVQPGYRVRLYATDLKRVSLITVSEYAVWSDGRTEPTGRSDTGRFEQRWTSFTLTNTKGQ